MKALMERSPMREQAADILLYARRLPRGQYRNDLRVLGRELLRLHKLGIRANVQVFDKGLTCIGPLAN